jgi:hypothetical protein
VDKIDDILNASVDGVLAGNPGSQYSSAADQGIANPAVDDFLASRGDGETPAADTTSSPEASGEGSPPRDNSTEFKDELSWAESRVRELNAETERLSRMRLALAAQQLQGPRPARPRPPDVPSYDEDPAEHLRHTQRQLAAQVSEVRQHLVNQARAQQNQQLAQGFFGDIEQHEKSFRAERPDYDEATTYLHQRRDRQLEAWGVKDPVQRQHILNNELVFLASTALSQGKNPAQVAYEAARRSGYGGAGNSGNTAQADPGSSWKRGFAPDVTARSLLDLDGAEFDAAWGKLFPRNF